MGELKKTRVKKRKAMLTGIRRRWLINSVGAALLIVIVSLATLAVIISNHYYSTVKASVEARADSYSSFFNKYFMTSYENYYQSASQWVVDFSDSDLLELQFITGSGRLEISTIGPVTGIYPDTPDIKQALETGKISTWRGSDPVTNERIMAVSAPLLYAGSHVVGAMRYVTSLDVVDRRILQIVGLCALVSLVFLSFVVITNLYFIRGLLAPLSEITDVTKRIAAGGYGAKIEKIFPDEIGELADNINNMSSEILASERMKSDFISSVSHELRTPLTAITGWGETLLSSDMSNPHEFKKGVRIMLKETGRLSKMVEELLDFTRMEGGRLTLRVEPLDITGELEEVVYLYMESMSREGIVLTCDTDDEMPLIHGDRARLKQVFVNVLDNAAKHGGGGKRIETRLFYENPWVTVTVRDYGQGIPAEELPHVKYKFYKGSSVARGSGIGLAVSDEIMRLHGGELEIQSTEGEGTTVTIRLPAES